MELVQSTGRLDKLRRRWAAAIADNVNPAGVPAQLSDDMLAQVRASARPESMEAFQSSVKALCEKAYEAVMGEIDAVELFEEQEHLLESGFSFLRHWTFEELLSVAPASLFEERGRRAVENQPLLAPIPPTILQDGPFVVAVQSPPLLSTNLTPPTERYVRFYRFHGSVHVHNE